MTDKEKQLIAAALQSLDDFASGAPLPRPWHDNWRLSFQRCIGAIRQIASNPKTDPAELGRTLLDRQVAEDRARRAMTASNAAAKEGKKAARLRKAEGERRKAEGCGVT